MVITFVLMLKVVLLDTYCHSGLRNRDLKMDLKAWKRTAPKKKWTLVVNMTGKLISLFFVLFLVCFLLLLLLLLFLFFCLFVFFGGEGVDIEVMKYF